MKIVDRPYHCQMLGQEFGVWQLHCHLRIFQAQNGVQTVMITDMGFEMGWFMSCLVEGLADRIVSEFNLNPAKLVWLEQYSANDRDLNATEFSQVTFEWENGQATNPQWAAIAPEAVQKLISETLQLVPV